MMKRIFKIGWLVLVVGLVATAIGYFNHGAQNVDLVAGRPHVQRPGNWQLTRRHFNQVDLDVTTADVTVKTGRHFAVTYQGVSRNRPRVTVKNGRLTVRQAAHDAILAPHQVNERLVVTVPRGTKLTASRIELGSGNLTVTGVNLADTKIKAASGDVDLTNVTLAGGQTHLSSGDFTAHRLRVNGHYQVKNESGDNETYATGIGGYRVQTDSGDNEVNGQDKDDQTVVTDNMTAANTLELVTASGDNELYY